MSWNVEVLLLIYPIKIGWSNDSQFLNDTTGKEIFNKLDRVKNMKAAPNDVGPDIDEYLKNKMHPRKYGT